MNTILKQPVHRGRRRGLTLLEVLISIGIVSIGLMGVMLILPVAGYRAGQGALADSRSMNGLNWVDEFHARGMAQPGLYIGNPTPAFSANTAFVIDPKFAARHAGGTVVDGNDPKRFPYASDAVVAVPRFSLRRALGDSQMLSAIAADSIFQSHDDLVTQLPDDLTDPPIQQIAQSGTGGAFQKRASTGKVSWMAMMTPAAPQGFITDTYRLSIVVFDSRNNDMPMGSPVDAVASDTDIDKVPTERVAFVRDLNSPTSWTAAFPGGGYHGGDMVLSVDAPGPSATGVIPGALTVRNNDWLLLSANSSTGPVHQWYRVAAFDPEVTAVGGGFQRSVTLQGPDWRLNNGGVTPGSLRQPQATLVSGVIGVFEKTIRLEEPSIWTVEN